jgi:hypothetical protein
MSNSRTSDFQNHFDVPTYDVADLEKKSPEELDAILRHMDELQKRSHHPHSYMNVSTNTLFLQII